jgi:uncharacterized protein
VLEIHDLRAMFRTALISICGAVLFYYLHIPMPWMLGPFFAFLIIQGMFKKQVSGHPIWMKVALIIIGYMLGSSFTSETMTEIGHYFPIILLATVVTILFSVLMGMIVSVLSGIDIKTGIIGFIPGGLTQMMALSQEIKNVNTSMVALMQMVRVLLIIVIIPWMATFGIFTVDTTSSFDSGIITENKLIPWYHYLFIGAMVFFFIWLVKKLHFPIPHLMGTLLAVILFKLLHIEIIELPHYILIIGQLLFGTCMGIQINLEDLKLSFNKVFIYTLISCILLIFFSLGFSWVLANLNDFSFISAFLSLAPGGMDVMGFTAKEANANLSMVTAFQLFRIFFIILFVPPLIKFFMMKKETQKGFES